MDTQNTQSNVWWRKGGSIPPVAIFSERWAVGGPDLHAGVHPRDGGLVCQSDGQERVARPELEIGDLTNWMKTASDDVKGGLIPPAVQALSFCF